MGAGGWSRPTHGYWGNQPGTPVPGPVRHDAIPLGVRSFTTGPRHSRDAGGGDRPRRKSAGAIDYEALPVAHLSGETPEDVGAYVNDTFSEIHARYAASTPWPPQFYEVQDGSATFLFDLAPAREADADLGDVRVVAVLWRGSAPRGPRDKKRQKEFLPYPEMWSKAGFERGHWHPHSRGGGLDHNLFPQAKVVNQGKLWKEFERRGALPDTTSIVCGIYDTNTWRPESLEYIQITGNQVRREVFSNAPAAGASRRP